MLNLMSGNPYALPAFSLLTRRNGSLNWVSIRLDRVLPPNNRRCIDQCSGRIRGILTYESAVP